MTSTNIAISSLGNISQDIKREKEFSLKLREMFPNGLKKILFIQPPDLDMNTFNPELAIRKRYWNYPPYGLMVLSSIVQNLGFSARISNLQNLVLEKTISIGMEAYSESEWKNFVVNELSNEIEEYKPDLIGLSCMFSLTHRSFIDCINIVLCLTNKPIAVGGVHVTNSFTDEKTKERFTADIGAANLLFEREADETLSQLVLWANKEGDDFFSPSGITILDRENHLNSIQKFSPPAEDKLNLIPAFNLSPPTELSRNGRIGTFESLLEKDTPIATALFNRGCRAECTFCSVRNFNGKGVRSKSVDAMIEELKILRYTHDIRHIMWLDDDLLFDRRKSIELFNRMVKENVDLTWDTTNGVIAASCTDEVISAASDSGCIGMILGMESGNDKILKKIKKPGNVRHFLAAAEVLRKYPKINTRVFIMLGFPGETFGQIRDTYNVASEMDLDWSNINILQPLPNTPIFNEMVAAGLLDPDAVDFEQISFSLGASGKLSGRRSGNRDMLADKFTEVFNIHNADDIPTRIELDDIWAFMNFHLNFKKLDLIEDKHKLQIQHRWLTSICDNLATRNGFAKYYLCSLDKKLYGSIPKYRINDLKKLIEAEPYWDDRLSEFGLDIGRLS